MHAVEATNPPRVGVMIPTYRRPDLARACVLQWLVQTLPPHCICVHQNGSDESYAWAVDDLHGLGRIRWIHTPARIAQHEWYRVPLQALLDEGCTHFFWADHDDWYRRDHAEQAVRDLAEADFSVASRCGTLYLRDADYRWEPDETFSAHSTGGMSSSMAFTRPFAERLVADLASHPEMQYADNVLALATLPHFRHHLSERRTTVYVSHAGSLTSADWLDEVMPQPKPPPPLVAASGIGPVLYGSMVTGYADVTAQVLTRCVAGNGQWRLPASDAERCRDLGDPAPNLLKHLVLKALPDAEGRLADRVLPAGQACTFRLAGGVLSAD